MVVSTAPDEKPSFSLPGAVPTPKGMQPDSLGSKRIRDAEMDVKVGLASEAGPSHLGFGFSVQDLCDINQEHDAAALQKKGGVPAVCRGLEVDPSRGILGDEADTDRRTDAFGSNTYPEKEGKSFWVYLLEATNDLTLRILAVCAVVSMAVGMVSHGAKEGWYDGVGIVIAVVLVVLLGAISNYRQALQFRSLNAEKRKVAVQVTRGGRRVRLTIFELLVGDVVHLNIGDQVPADGLFLEGHSLTVDESAMTGESDPMHKDARRPFMISGCKVVDGFGTMMVTAVGLNTEWGKVMSTLNEENDAQTPLQERLEGVAKFMSKVGLTVALFVFIVLVARYFADRSNFRTNRFGKRRDTLGHAKAIIDFFAIFVTIVVVAIPEGLPLAVTLALAYSMRKMMADKALVRHLAACETMGSATTICSDKTGTLTLNQMTVVQAWVAGALGDVAAVKPIKGQAAVEAPPAAVQAVLFEAVGLNTNSSVYQPEGGGETEVAGSPTEAAVLTWGLKLGLDFERLRAQYEVVHVEAFNSAKKRMGVLVRGKEGARALNLHWKGAAEIVLGQCTHLVDGFGDVAEMSESKREELLLVIQNMAVNSLRTLCLAYRPATDAEAPPPGAEDEGSDKYQLPETSLVCLAIVGIKDPPRPEVPEAMRLCREAGVKVRMVTGDNLVTAKAIATEVGILTPGGLAMEGKEFRALSDADRVAVLRDLQVLARSSPTDKHLLVKTLRSMKHVVGVTGDGTNDAPALKEADIGLAMGIAGTEVAKESADIVILDDNFSSIVKVIKWGRSVYANIQKFLQFQLTINCVALLINLISAIAVGDSPLTVVQMLWVNLMADSLAALALATEPPTDDLLKRKPVGRSDPIITPVMWRNIIGMSAYQLTVLLLLQFVGHRFLPGVPRSKSHETPVQDSEYADKLDVELVTLIFNSFVMCQIFNEVNARKPNEINVLSGLFGNWIFISVLVLTAALQYLLVTFAGDFASTRALDGQQWAVCIVIGAIGMPVAALIKLIPVPDDLFVRWKKNKDYEIDSTPPALPPALPEGLPVIRS